MTTCKIAVEYGILLKRVTSLGVSLFALFVCQNKCACSPAANPFHAQQKQSSPANRTAKDQSMDMLDGEELTQSEAENLEKSLLKTPDDFAARVKLADYYASLNIEGNYQKQTKHILWIIKHHAESEIAGSVLCIPLAFPKSEEVDPIKKAWQEQIATRPACAAVLANAGLYLTVRGDEAAPKLLMKAHSLEPQNPKWLTLLGQYYKILIHKGHLSEQKIAENRQYASKSLDFYNRALTLTKGIKERASILSELPPLAFTAARFEEARQYGNLLLNMPQQHPKMFSSGICVCVGHSVLGKLELREGHVEQAKQHLLASADIKEALSDKLLPEMSLAKELLKADQRQTVIKFLTRCKKFCKRSELDDWISEIERGLTPDFDSSPF